MTGRWVFGVVFLCLAAVCGVFAQSEIDRIRAEGLRSEGLSAEELGRLAQSSEDNQSLAERALLATSTPDYPVTPGDTYSLTFTGVGAYQSKLVTVQSDYTLNLGTLGKVSASGLTYPELQDRVEQIVTESYPGSSPDFTIRSVGSFEVYVRGEVKRAQWVPAWGLARLSTVVGELPVSYGSLRNVRITSADGRTQSYDLFRAKRFGEVSNDPYVAPGDRVTVPRAERIVHLKGEVRRPGSYQLLPEDGLVDVLESYGGGLTVNADWSRVQITRAGSRSEAPAQVLRVNVESGDGSNLVPEDQDVVVVPSRLELLPVVYLEGALVLPELAPPRDAATTTEDQRPEEVGEEEMNGQEAEQAVIKIRHRLRDGETLFAVLNKNEKVLSPDADLSEAFIVREGRSETIPVDLEALLYDYSPEKDRTLRKNDRIVIPYGDFEVFVTGEVQSSEWVQMQTLTRLSEILEDRLTNHSSIRDIIVTGETGQSIECDLFRADRFGDKSQDPYLRPGDTVRIQTAARRVRINGQVQRPGSYQLLPGEQLDDLIDLYGGGFETYADSNRISITRADPTSESVLRLIHVDLDAVRASDVLLQDRDAVTVQSRLDRLPVVYLEGAVTPNGRIRYRLRDGDTLYTVLDRHRGSIAPTADLARGFIARGGEAAVIQVDMEMLLYDFDPSQDMSLRKNDRIVIPYGNVEVFLTGEVDNDQWIAIQPLTRLSSLVAGNLTPYSSTRDILVTSASGQETTYDLFRAQRYGEKEQNPYLQRGDTVTVREASRKVTINGEVRRPGTYQLLPEDDLNALIRVYADGYTLFADRDSVVIERYQTPDDSVARNLRIDEMEGVDLRNRDVVTIENKLRELPHVVFEGAVTRAAAEPGTALNTSSQFRYTFRPGELLSDAVFKLEDRFGPESDLAASILYRRDGSAIAIDIDALLNRSPDARDVELQPQDQIVVPFRQYFVVVSGAVRNPDRYPYIPGRSYKYYVDLAGGFDPQLHIGDAVTITDPEDELVPDAAEIEPEYKIKAPINNPLYHIGIVSSLLSAAASVFAVVISILR